ncbi:MULTISPECIES: MerR family transcriptional regulator [Streptomyces]|uniref:MerR family transcriptional regulator n=2 Tax=Streptomyces TaxID=1883 RepID=A0A3M8EW05_9ACTN|nr:MULTISPECIES: MerR family transcriptional regulator [Streptomyces]KNE82951.1 MerR family transcriptional regulator [Streptomyces fradiae]OFA52903.1 MerR family transcriptional regulator [Streptomyces fradiae]PQM20359.1 MerR family transcriptional regulator [Streptomyces xinghaiensis]RKM91168.1 MerR family transcriptional regulator [Streptomyces xinghaiensis]RNC69662.1 MerR family transcriptional regulator [Streptomyces xinghaiensis]
MEWSIQDIARRAGTTSRTLRHYDDIGLLPPSRIGGNGYRYYDQSALVRLQRILLLRELGLGLPAIAEVLAGQRDETAALRTHLRLLEHERERIGRQIASVRTTLRKTEEGEELMADEILDGFDHDRHKEEVIERWGRDAYESSDRWWRSLGDEGRQSFQQRELDIALDFGKAARAGASPDSEEAQAITRRHYTWLSDASPDPSKGYFIGLAEMYVADPRFAAHYDRHGEGVAEFVRDAMKVYAERHLGD